MTQPYQDPDYRSGGQPPASYAPANPYQPQGYQNGGGYPPGPNQYGERPDTYSLPSANGTLILVLGILSLFFVGMVLGPLAWVLGNNAIAAIDGGRANPAERGQAVAGKICGIAGTCLNVIGIGVWIFMWIAFSAYGPPHHT